MGRRKPAEPWGSCLPAPELGDVLVPSPLGWASGWEKTVQNGLPVSLWFLKMWR